MASPWQCACDERTIDYSAVEHGRVWCVSCRRIWTLGPRGWIPNPLVRRKP